MAESKRQSIGGNRSGTSTPKPSASTKGPTATGPGELDFGKIIGARVKVTTCAPSTVIEGTIYTACPITNLLAISRTSGTSHAISYNLIPVSRIQSFAILELPAPGSAQSITATFENAQPQIARVDLKALKAREEAAIRKVRERDAMRGKGVSKEAQDIFDALSRQLPLRWHGTSIIVNDAVIIKSPYRPEDCTAPKDQSNTLSRIKKVLENERKKLAQKSDAESSAANAPAPNIGVGAGRGTGIAVATPVLPRKGG